MKKFIVIYHSPAEAIAQMANATDEQKAQVMDAWMGWKAKNENHVVDFGAPLAGGKKLNGDGKWDLSTNEVNGYSIVQGESNEEVEAIFKDHPHLALVPGSAIEVHEVVAM